MPGVDSAASSLAAIRTSVASSVTLRPAASTPPASSVVCRSPRAGSRRVPRSSPTASRARRSPAARGSAGGRRRRSKQTRVPRWQVGPTGSTVRGAHPRRSRPRGRRAAARCRSSRPCARVGRASASGSGPRRSPRSRASASASIQASIRTRPSAASWTIAGHEAVVTVLGRAARAGRHAATSGRRPDRQPCTGHRGLDATRSNGSGGGRSRRQARRPRRRRGPRRRSPPARRRHPRR